jgi:NAD(P)H-dependent FMN reductase
MSEAPLNVLAVAGSLHGESVTKIVVHHLANSMKLEGCHVDVVDLGKEGPALYNPDSSHGHPSFAALQQRVDRADVFILGTPDYHGSISGALKNFLDHFWREFAGKLFVTIVASHEKGLTVTDQLRTIARQCYAWSMPYGVSFAENHDVKGGQIVNENFKQRLEMTARDARIYGSLLAHQRRTDLAGNEPGFMARHRK